MDRRQAKTRKAVMEAFTNLLEHKSYGNITVQEIIDAADIGRSTFYAHFETKDDLLRVLCEEIFSHVFSEKPHKEKTHDFSSGTYGMAEKVTHMLYQLGDNRSYLKGILSGESSEIFMRYFREHLTEIFDDALQGKTKKIPRDYLLNHATQSFAETVRWWMVHEKYKPEELCAFYMEAVPFFGQ
ncbi:MAG: TetR/AcrR family transcriptional regulator [Lachnospiraceae bacterium]|nr:TetR/AcrR family transcriptional regulator [Lachnospiraceae bacterium]